MTGLEVLLIILGFVLIGLSFFLSEKGEKSRNNEPEANVSSAEIWSEKDENIVKKRIEDIINEKSLNIIEDTQDRLNQLSNEKIMAVDEFSNQLIEKIEQNHKEVVFIYNMLGEKEVEIKKLMAYLRKMVLPVEDKTIVKKETKEKTMFPEKSLPLNEIKSQKDEIAQNESAEDRAIIREKNESIVNKRKTAAEEVSKNVSKDMWASEKDTNKRIKAMYQSGKSILEISKEMGMGQGEVKLVIDLYGGRR